MLRMKGYVKIELELWNKITPARLFHFMGMNPLHSASIRKVGSLLFAPIVCPRSNPIVIVICFLSDRQISPNFQ